MPSFSVYYLHFPMMSDCSLTACYSSSFPCSTLQLLCHSLWHSLWQFLPPALTAFAVCISHGPHIILCLCGFITFTFSLKFSCLFCINVLGEPILSSPNFTYCPVFFSPQQRLLFSTAPQALISLSQAENRTAAETSCQTSICDNELCHDSELISGLGNTAL